MDSIDQEQKKSEQDLLQLLINAESENQSAQNHDNLVREYTSILKYRWALYILIKNKEQEAWSKIFQKATDIGVISLNSSGDYVVNLSESNKSTATLSDLSPLRNEDTEQNMTQMVPPGEKIRPLRGNNIAKSQNMSPLRRTSTSSEEEPYAAGSRPFTAPPGSGRM